MKRTIKIASNVYQRLSHQAEKEGKTISELASSTLAMAFGLNPEEKKGGETKQKMDEKEKNEKVVELEKRTRNLEMWLATVIPYKTFIYSTGWGGEMYEVSRNSAYKSTISHPETLQEEENAVRTAIKEGWEKGEEERLKSQREEIARLTEIKAEQKLEIEERKRKDEEARIQKMRKDVEEYDNQKKKAGPQNK